MPFFIIFIKIFKVKYALFIFFISFSVFSQEDFKEKIDSLYREDQMYVTLSLDLIQNKLTDFKQHSLSSGVSLGFLRDMPISKNRRWSIAPGLGYSYNNLKNNIRIENSLQEVEYSFNNVFDKNKLVLHQLDVPLEVRWRSSSYTSHKFWRIYTGFKVSYLFASKSEYVSTTESITVRNNNDLSKIKYGTYIAVGNNTGNIYVYYALSPIFNNVTIGNQDINLSSLNVGFVFYIL
jgi:hypothetical protein